MAYTKYNADWKDFPDTTTPITADALDQIETGIANAHVTADGAVQRSLVDAKGDMLAGTAADTLARVVVGANGTVLVADSTAAAGVAWSANVPVASLQEGSNGEFLSTIGGIATWTSSLSPNYGTALPGSPEDGAQAILVDSTTAPTYAWVFRYVSAKSSNKWVYIGGNPAHKRVATTEAQLVGGGAYGDLATVGPDFTIPVSGNYLVTVGFQAYNANATTRRTSYMSFDIGATAAVDANAAMAGDMLFNATSLMYTASYSSLIAATAANLIRCKYRANTGTDIRFGNRWLSVMPTDVGG